MPFTLPKILLGAAVLCGLLAPSRGVQAAVVLQNNGVAHVAWEAETESAIINGAPAIWVRTNDAAASGGGTLYIEGRTDNALAPHSFVQYSIRFSAPGTYNLYYRWKADATRTVADQFTANSTLIPNALGALSTAGPAGLADFHTAASNGTQAPANNVFDWSREADTATYEVTAAQVAAGLPLILTIATREAGFSVDRWVLSPDPALSDAALDASANSDTSLVAQGSNDSYVAFEAENRATIINGAPAIWVNTNDVLASGSGALYIEGRTDNALAPHSFAQYRIRFAKAGTYNLYYRWKADAARTVADQFTANSTLIPNALGALSTAGPAGLADFHTAASNGTQAPANNVYDWSREADTATYTVSDAEAAAGVPLILTIATREAGFTVDRWVLHPDASLTDAALEALPNSGAAVVGPELVKAVGSAALNQVRVFFTRPLLVSSVAPGRFTLSGGLTVSSAAVNPDDGRQVLLTTSAATPGTKYSVTVSGVTDTSGGAIAANSQTDFTAWKLVNGWATTEIYQNVAGALVDELKNAPAFIAGQPDEIRWVKGFQLNNDPRAPNMGAKIFAFFQPQTSGGYNFYANNDDEAELLLSDSQSEAGLQSLNVFQLSAVFDDAIYGSSGDLTAGQKYLLQGLVHSGGGDVFLNVVAQPASASAPAATLPILGGARIATYVNPDLGNVTFTQQPADVSAEAGARARFSVKVQASEAPVYYQWQRDGQDIAGATRAAYVTPTLAAAGSGQRYRVVVSVAGKDTPSGEATLTVTPGEPSNLQPYVGINFVGGGDNLPGPLAAVEVAGVALQENWNNLTGFTFDQAPLVDAAGAASPVTLTAAATDHWYSGTLGAGDANGALLQGFLSSGASLEPFVITLNGVPAGNYNVIVYSVGFPFQAAYEEDIALTGAGNYPTYQVNAESGLEYNANPQFRRMSSTGGARATGNYVQFDGVSPASDGSLAISTTWVSTQVGNGHQPAVNAIQLVKVNPIVARPSLAVVKQGAAWNLSWGAAAGGFILETSPKVGAGAAWTAAAGTSNPLAGAGTLGVNVNSSATAFFRLRRP